MSLRQEGTYNYRITVCLGTYDNQIPRGGKYIYIIFWVSLLLLPLGPIVSTLRPCLSQWTNRIERNNVVLAF